MNSIGIHGSKENASFIKEIQMMMFGLGDSAIPLQSTAVVVEEILQQQMVTIISMAEEVADRRGVDAIYPQDILFLMRKDVFKLMRIVNYIGFKDMKKAITGCMNNGDMADLSDLLPSAEGGISQWESKRKQMCQQFLSSIGIDLDSFQNRVDTVKQDRLLRADQRVQNMSHKTFEDYNKSRRMTFLATKFTDTRFQDWLRQKCSDSSGQKLKLFSLDMLSYLAKETVAQLIDLALLLRQDASVSPHDPFSRANHITLPHDETFGSSHRQLEGFPPITPNEVREVLRRFYSAQLCPWGAFTTNLHPTVYNKILVF